MRITLFGIGVLLAAIGAAAQVQDPLDTLAGNAEKSPADLIALGDLYIEAMRLPEAARAYRQAMSKNDPGAEAQFGMARIQIARGNFKKAKTACRRLAHANKKKSIGEICSGWFWLSNDRSARAVEEFQKAIDKGDMARGKTGMGEVYRRQSEHEKAIAAYSEALKAGAGYIAHIGLGLTLEQKGDRQGALQAFREAVSNMPASCLARYHYGRALGRGREAVHEIQTAIAIRQAWPEAYQVLADIHYEEGAYALAVEAYKQATKGETGIAFLGLGKALYKTAKPEAARKALLRASELTPDLIGIYKLLAHIQFELGDYDGTDVALNKMKDLAPEDAMVYLHCGAVYYKMERHTTARSFLEQAISMKPSLSHAHYLLGRIACKRRLYQPGREHFRQALVGDLAGVDKNEIEKQLAACVPKR